MQNVLTGPMLAEPPVRTLFEALERVALRPGPCVTVHAAGRRDTLTGPEVASLAMRWARALHDQGVRAGDRVGLLLPNDERFVGAFFGCQSLGAVAVPLSWPVSLVDIRGTLAHLAPIVADAAPVALVTTPSIALMAPFGGLPVLVEPAASADGFPADAHPPSLHDPAFLQYTSGSLGRPRGVVIPHRAAAASAWSMGQALGLGPDDVGVSWLPLFHDMGLVGSLLCPLIVGFPLHLLSPGEFLLHPGRWLRCISEVRGTVSAAPDFAYGLVTRRVRDLDGLDLSSWRHALDGAEPVHRATLQAFAARFGPVGFRADALHPVYGLAENTLGVCFGEAAEPDRVWQGRTVVSVGRPLPGMQVKVAENGEVLVRGPARMDGYFGDALATADAFRDGWLHTGDLGFLADGRLYLTGREKDLVIQNGRKFHPYDIERIAAAAVDAVANGAAAFADADEALVVVVEAGTRVEDVETRVRGELLATLGVRPDRVVRVAPGDLPRTTSGKLRRTECVERYA
ncbi:MAG: AMP-binding protein [Pseudomonadota bacterium]|nr:AMP-binding protein [Pseudomonadota bacterium]